MQYKSDKTTFEHAFLLFMLGTVALEALQGDYQLTYSKPVREKLKVTCEGKDVSKIIKRCQRMGYEVIGICQDKSENKVDGHKFILILYALAQNILDSGYILPPEVIESFEPFLELEADQTVKYTGQIITNEDWLKMKNSAEKLAKKVFLRLKEQNYYLT